MKKLDGPVKKQVQKVIDRIESRENPRSLGEALTAAGSFPFYDGD
jgi:hypothetical protein